MLYVPNTRKLDMSDIQYSCHTGSGCRWLLEVFEKSQVVVDSHFASTSLVRLLSVQSSWKTTEGVWLDSRTGMRFLLFFLQVSSGLSSCCSVYLHFVLFSTSLFIPSAYLFSHLLIVASVFLYSFFDDSDFPKEHILLLSVVEVNNCITSQIDM